MDISEQCGCHLRDKILLYNYPIFIFVQDISTKNLLSISLCLSRYKPSFYFSNPKESQ